MGFSQSKFLALPPKARAKKLADLLRVILLQLGQDWQKAPPEYDLLVAWHCKPEQLIDFQIGKSLHHGRILDLYQHWRDQAGLGAERDVYLQADPGDRLQAIAPPLEWHVLVHNLRSAYNVGSIIRSVDCFGLGDVHLSGYTPSADHPSLRSAARGAEAWIPHRRWGSPIDCLQQFGHLGFPIVALETGDDAIPLPQMQWPSKGILVVGNEELGIAPELLTLCQHKVYIPMYGRKASLNVASAFAIAAQSLRSSNL